MSINDHDRAWLRRMETKHSCQTPRTGAEKGDVWACSVCNRRWTCYSSTREVGNVYFTVKQSFWRRRWWPWPRLPLEIVVGQPQAPQQPDPLPEAYRDEIFAILDAALYVCSPDHVSYPGVAMESIEEAITKLLEGSYIRIPVESDPGRIDRVAHRLNQLVYRDNNGRPEAWEDLGTPSRDKLRMDAKQLLILAALPPSKEKTEK